MSGGPPGERRGIHDNFGRVVGQRDIRTKWDRDLAYFQNKYSGMPIRSNQNDDDDSLQGMQKKTTRKYYQPTYGGEAYEDPNAWHSHIKGGFGHERDNTFKSNKMQLDADGGYRWENMAEDDETTQAGGPILEFLNQWILANIRVPPSLEFRSVVDGDMDRKKHNYECILSIPGFPHSSRKKAGTKGEAKKLVAVDFIQYLVNNNHMSMDQLPDFFDKKYMEGKDHIGRRDISKAQQPSNKFLTKEEQEKRKQEREARRAEKADYNNKRENFGWDKRSARFRLHKFCRENDIAADIKVVAHGTEYSIVNEATIKFKYDGKTYETAVKDRNKRWAQNLASLQIVNQLCADSHIEKCDNARKWYALQEGSEKRMWQKVDHGGWSLETARPRLYRFLKEHKIYQSMIFTVFGNPPIERHIAEIKFVVSTTDKNGQKESLEVNGRGEAPSKDLAERRCALHTLMQLHRFKMVDKEAEDKEAERQLALGTVETIKLGVSVPKSIKRQSTFKFEDSKFYQMTPMNVYKRQKKTDLFTASFDSMGPTAKKRAYAINEMSDLETEERNITEMHNQVEEDMEALAQHADYLQPEADWEKFKAESISDMDNAFRELMKSDPNLMSLQCVDVSPFGLAVRDEFVITRVIATKKRPTRDILEVYTKKLPQRVEMELNKRKDYKSSTQTQMAFKECAIRMNIIRQKIVKEKTDAAPDLESMKTDTTDIDLHGAITSKPVMKEEQEAIRNDENTCVLYMEILFTSPECSTKVLDASGVDTAAPVDTGGLGPAVSRFAVLPLVPSLEANRALRRKTWFENEIKSDKRINRDFVPCARILRDLAYRWPNWQPLQLWHILQISYLALKGVRWQVLNYRQEIMYYQNKKHFNIVDSLRRIFELIASGFLLHSGVGIIDPCETGEIDVFGDLTLEMRNTVTLAAQNALRCLHYGKLAWYLSDPDVLQGVSGDRFGYGEEETKVGKVEMEEVAGYLVPRQVESAPAFQGANIESTVGQEHKDEVDDQVADFMKEFD